ncbi:MAG TPA: helix-turn-helix transcriptional regulator [Bradyrhizobium sp.]|nr:helix-turn-helix transcriptional regulator [Bradyrhizobium sp.]
MRDRRKSAGLTQTQLAKRLGRYQSYVSMIEAGELRIGVLEFLELAEAVGFDPAAAMRRLTKIQNA